MNKRQNSVKTGEPLTLSFFLHLDPVAKGRPRAGRTRAGDTVVYTPGNTRVFETHVKILSRREWGLRPPLNCPTSLSIVFYMPKPMKPQSPYPIGRPDLDNLAKAVTDAMNGIVISDDSRIVDLVLKKRYSSVRVGVQVDVTNQIPD